MAHVRQNLAPEVLFHHLEKQPGKQVCPSAVEVYPVEGESETTLGGLFVDGLSPSQKEGIEDRPNRIAGEVAGNSG